MKRWVYCCKKKVKYIDIIVSCSLQCGKIDKDNRCITLDGN